MNTLAAIRLEAVRLAEGDLKKAAAIEKWVRRGIRRDELAGGCKCREARKRALDTPAERHDLLHQSAPALTGVRMQDMTVAQLVTDADLVFTQRDGERIDGVLKRYGLARGMSATEIGAWVAG